MRFVPRAIQNELLRAARGFPAAVLTGPRRAGKTALLRHAFPGAQYVLLEDPDVQARVRSDPRGFLDELRPPVLFDEIQNAPELFDYIRARIDGKPRKMGQWLFTGSQEAPLMRGVSESMAGRAAILQLLPFSLAETDRVSLLAGGYPEVLARPAGRGLWFASYIQTYLERDVRSLRQVGDLISFQSFLRALAARTGQLLNLTDISRDLGVAVNTAKAWLSVLEATFQVIVLRPYHANVGKRLVKTPKVYFTDTGMLCYLAGLKDPDHAAAGPLGGAIFETAVLLEIVKVLVNRGEEPQIHFWRTSVGVEVDLVVEAGGKLIPIEVKLSATPRPAMASGIRAFQEDLGEKAGPGFVIHPGDVRLPLAPKVVALPFTEL